MFFIGINSYFKASTICTVIGCGITPIEDHFSAVLQIEAVLPDGSIYYSKMHELGGVLSDRVFKWKLGPYLEGLFVQGNMGIVTQATIALARRPESITQFFINVADKDFETCMRTVSKLKQHLGSQLGGINMVNQRRLLAMSNVIHWPTSQLASENEIRAIAQKNKFADWTIVGAIYSPKELNLSLRSIVKKKFSMISQRTLFIDQKKIFWLKFNSFGL